MMMYERNEMMWAKALIFLALVMLVAQIIRYIVTKLIV